ncbi:hypothetical protein G3567_02505 [Psychroflexus sp. YR1-1]|uniref:Uncharacterized protein n=1 Tax=Psychroflexus aurantiacus TaxID=2709310 RepID=A0A6B3R1T3_9FLAO|nr:hypothetical protein [Psychroflexus aurantiacus]NEV93017.1 hypothetical protein [Psychroflexus aurantiacus]
MKSLNILALILFLGGTQLCVAQGKITDFKSVIQEAEYGGVEVVIKPLAFDPSQKDYKSYKHKYGVRICYTVKGNKKAARQDMSFKIHNTGEFSYRLAYGSSYKPSDVNITDIQYFNMEDTPKSQWPRKEDCF